MAWRITTNLIDGVLDNTAPGKVTGTLRFIGRKRSVRLELDGDFQGECQGKRLTLRHSYPEERNSTGEKSYMAGFKAVQRGAVGTMQVDERGAYLEWYGETNGRVVIELAKGEVEVVAGNNG